MHKEIHSDEFMEEDAKRLTDEIGALDGVEAIALGGSRAGGAYDALSDYDVYVYCTERPSDGTRLEILEKYCRRIELGNSFWEYEDDVTLTCGTDMDILYRNIDGFAADISSVADGCNAHNGYTTCMWYNLVNCRILLDKRGRLGELQRTYTRPYPERLKENIIARNSALLRGNLPSYDMQIKKAAKRGDLVAVNHRVTEFLASYFDILFALNGRLHPGEKRLMELCESMCPVLPANFRTNLEELFRSMYGGDAGACLDGITDELFKILG